jgi:hypothetical protein
MKNTPTPENSTVVKIKALKKWEWLPATRFARNFAYGLYNSSAQRAF